MPVSPALRWLIRLLEIGCNFGDILGRERSATDLDQRAPEREVFARRLKAQLADFFVATLFDPSEPGHAC